jgi:L-fuculose-phosphate aldolase
LNDIERLKCDVQRYGEKLMRFGLVHSQVGNLSVRVNDSLLITSHGCPLDEVTIETIVALPLQGAGTSPTHASSDAPIHRAIYAATNAAAIIHAHSPYAVAESILTPDVHIVTEDVETRYLLKEIPLIGFSADPAETANGCAEALRTHVAIIVRGHGTIAAGATLKEAYLYVSSVEHACKVRNLCR